MVIYSKTICLPVIWLGKHFTSFCIPIEWPFKLFQFFIANSKYKMTVHAFMSKSISIVIYKISSMQSFTGRISHLFIQKIIYKYLISLSFVLIIMIENTIQYISLLKTLHFSRNTLAWLMQKQLRCIFCNFRLNQIFANLQSNWNCEFSLQIL